MPSPAGGIEAFIISGITPDERELIGPPPVGHGLLPIVLTEGQRLRLDEKLDTLNSSAEPQLLRIIQEALTNVRKHSTATMQERAESIGGTLLVTSTPGAGTRVEVRIPTVSTAVEPSARPEQKKSLR